MDNPGYIIELEGDKGKLRIFLRLNNKHGLYKNPLILNNNLI